MTSTTRLGLVFCVLARTAWAGEATFTARSSDGPAQIVVTVNGRQVFPADAPVRVRVAQRRSAFDRVEVRQRDESQRPWVHFAQLRAGADYVVRENPCSLFDLWDQAAPESAMTHWVRFRVAPGVSQAISFRAGLGEHVAVQPGATSAPIAVTRGGAMCEHASAEFDALPARADWATARPKHVGFFFMNDQVLVVTYVGPKAELAVSVEDRPADLTDPSATTPEEEAARAR
jgi:hypothetical protein